VRTFFPRHKRVFRFHRTVRCLWIIDASLAPAKHAACARRAPIVPGEQQQKPRKHARGMNRRPPIRSSWRNRERDARR